jgi:hypothetical protein
MPGLATTMKQQLAYAAAVLSYFYILFGIY